MKTDPQAAEHVSADAADDERERLADERERLAAEYRRRAERAHRTVAVLRAAELAGDQDGGRP